MYQWQSFLHRGHSPGFCPGLLVAVAKFWDKFASLQQVNSSNSQDKFQIFYTDMYLVRFTANFMVLCMFLWILRDFADLLGICSSSTARNIRSLKRGVSQIVLWSMRVFSLMLDGPHWLDNILLGLVVKGVKNSICQINCYPVDMCWQRK